MEPWLSPEILVGAFHLSLRVWALLTIFYFLETSLGALGTPVWTQSKFQALFSLRRRLEVSFGSLQLFMELFTSKTSCSGSCRSFSSLFERDELLFLRDKWTFVSWSSWKPCLGLLGPKQTPGLVSPHGDVAALWFWSLWFFVGTFHIQDFMFCLL